MKIKAIYDNGGKTFDRFTVYYDVKERNGHYEGRGMSENPMHPQGFGQCCSGQLGRHNGKRITLEELPAKCQEIINRDIETLSA